MNHNLIFKNYPNLTINIKKIHGYIPYEDEIIYAELVFTTSMNGYIETLTDPSYYNQGLVFSFPSIGNYGLPHTQNFYNSQQHKLLIDNGYCKSTYLPYLENNYESNSIQPSFIIVEKWVDIDNKLHKWFIKEKIPILEVHSVKPIITLIRDYGSQYVKLIYKNYLDNNTNDWIDFTKINYQKYISIKTPLKYPGFIYKDDESYNYINNLTNEKPLLFIDFGCKNAQIREFISRGITVLIVPWNYLINDSLTITEIINLYCGIFLSSGPGNPSVSYLKPIINKLEELINYIEEFKINTFPIFGICLGHQLIGQALGANIDILPYGHRGIHHPIKLLYSENINGYLTSKGYITSQNHGYFLNLDNLIYNQIKPLFIHGFDNTNQGIYHYSIPIYSVQFHPEACPGPKDTLFLFDYFAKILHNKFSITGNIYSYILSINNKPLYYTNNINKILLIGSGGLQIGQAGEFDYSCSQAIKAFQSIGHKVILLNPNVATIQTTLADQTYYLPLTLKYLKQVIKEQKPDAIAHSFGGQTALNLCIDAFNSGLLHDIQILGTLTTNCFKCENRRLFTQVLEKNGLSKYIIPSITLSNKLDFNNNKNIENIITDNFKYPLFLRNSMALGGAGSCIINNEFELVNYFSQNEIIDKNGIEICQSILGWKEIEVEVMRDIYSNVCIICSMENLDPVGFHTGESVVVAPCQTLNDSILQECRTAAIKCANAFNLIGEGNIQFAIHPLTEEIRIIEMNPRLSRSSALASKATAYPIAYIAAKLQLGYSLLEIQNDNVASNLQISAFYEPVLDYFAIKMPRWDINKLLGLTDEIGTAMKSVGEVLSISRNMTTALINAMSSTGNFTKNELEFKKIELEDTLDYYKKNKNTTRRWISIYNMINNNLEKDIDIQIHNYYLNEIKEWFSLININNYNSISYIYNDIDSFSGEIPTKSNYRYLTPRYDNSYLEKNITLKNNIKQKILNNSKKYKGKVIIIGGGTYRIGSSVEFDWCCVSSAIRARELGYYVVMINDNPETVSTDYQECDALYMENPNFENLKAIYKIETKLCQYQGIEMLGVIVSMGGQTSNNLVMDCVNGGINILGTNPGMIDMAEDRSKFSALLDKLQIVQPKWINARNITEVLQFCYIVDYPCLIRPSFVLSGAGMKVIYNEDEALEYLKKAQDISGVHPVVVSKFIENAKEIEVDAIAQDGEIRAMAISEHIEDAGCHSGDAHIISPPIDLTHETLKRVKAIAHTLAIYLEISGPFNLQLLAKDDNLKVIELNLRASRSMPFVSRVYKFNFISLATEIILDSQKIPKTQNFNDKIEMIKVPKYLTSVKTRNLQTIGVKAPQFSFHRFPEIEQNVNVEMMSTGENACFSKNKYKAYLRAISASGFKLPKSNLGGKLLLICSSSVKKELERYLMMFMDNKWTITDYISLSSNEYRNKFIKYDLIFYVKDNYQVLDKLEELELNKLRNVVRNKKQIKFLTKAICYCLDKI